METKADIPCIDCRDELYSEWTETVHPEQICLADG